MMAFALMTAVASPTRAETQIAGAPDALSLEAHETTLQAVLATLSASFGIHIRTSTDLNRPVDGSYKGSLREVVARLLNGYDFFMHRSGNGMEIVVVGVSGTPAAGAAAVAAAPMVTQPSREPIDRRGF
jgi:hypothetical protein